MFKDLNLENALKVLSVVGAVVTFAWGVWVWQDDAAKDRAAAESAAAESAESRRIEATKPFLDRQLKLYTEATQVTAKIATSSDPAEVAAATKRFWELYWGELALVENKGVAMAMVNFKNGLKAKMNQDQLAILSLKLAEACSESLSRSWGIAAWEHPDDAAKPAATSVPNP